MVPDNETQGCEFMRRLYAHLLVLGISLTGCKRLLSDGNFDPAEVQQTLSETLEGIQAVDDIMEMLFSDGSEDAPTERV